MSRAKGGPKRKNHRKKILKLAKGYWGRRRTNFKAAKDAVAKGLSYAYRDRRDRKGDFRRLWIIRINAACRAEEFSYSRLVDGLNKAGITINRKVLANMTIEDTGAFKAVVAQAKAALGA